MKIDTGIREYMKNASVKIGKDEIEKRLVVEVGGLKLDLRDIIDTTKEIDPVLLE